MECYVEAQGARSWMLGEGSLGWFERIASRAFPSDLWWFWHFLNVNGLLSSMYEVPVKLPGALEVCCCCCLLHLVILLWRISNLEQRKLFSCGNHLLRHDVQFGINLSQDVLAGVTWWGCPIFCKSEDRIIFQDDGRFSEKPIGSLKYWMAWFQMSKNNWVWCLLGDELVFREFLQRNFPIFSVRRDNLEYFGKLFVNLIEFYTFKEFFYLPVFLDIWKCRFCLLLPFENLWTLNCPSIKFW